MLEPIRCRDPIFEAAQYWVSVGVRGTLGNHVGQASSNEAVGEVRRRVRCPGQLWEEEHAAGQEPTFVEYYEQVRRGDRVGGFVAVQESGVRCDLRVEGHLVAAIVVGVIERSD
jgi:hypothetical protein